MTSLNHLPNELLSLIITYLDDNLSDLKSLSLVNRRLYGITRDLIHRDSVHIPISLWWDAQRDMAITSSIFNTIQVVDRAANRNPKVCSVVFTFHVTTDEPQLGERMSPFKPEVLLLLFMLVHVPKLEIVGIDLVGIGKEVLGQLRPFLEALLKPIKSHVLVTALHAADTQGLGGRTRIQRERGTGEVTSAFLLGLGLTSSEESLTLFETLSEDQLENAKTTTTEPHTDQLLYINTASQSRPKPKSRLSRIFKRKPEHPSHHSHVLLFATPGNWLSHVPLLPIRLSHLHLEGVTILSPSLDYAPHGLPHPRYDRRFPTNSKLGYLLMDQSWHLKTLTLVNLDFEETVVWRSRCGRRRGRLWPETVTDRWRDALYWAFWERERFVRGVGEEETGIERGRWEKLEWLRLEGLRDRDCRGGYDGEGILKVLEVSIGDDEEWFRGMLRKAGAEGRGCT
ncbi:hypothetical protein BJ508DRAFT_21301 [Ascobolus immersus RN42]|uniref:F-box domain-containing protein n=1 Tax=Ascobolus immersus RN42 TaxID=1160509 RepID=A0A3N4HNK0_ASCIM|nr:hypothetical protein BJ508DRAFT_21301 [Ascobolus immersus RN42]